MIEFELSQEEFEIWLMWKHSFKIIFDSIFTETDISDGDFMVLDLLTCSAEGKLRQQELANAMDWTKSRLSHHLSRMEKRNLVMRTAIENEKGVNVSITPNGRLAFNKAVPLISKNIKKYFIDQLTASDIKSIKRIAKKAKMMDE